MSLADIVRKIERDAATEAAEIVRAAELDAERMRTEAADDAQVERERSIAQAHAIAEEDARMRVAAARLAGRDRLLAEKRVMIDRVLRRAIERLETLPDEEYASLLAREIAASARGGEDVALGELDSERLATHLPAALRELDCDVRIAESTSAIQRGAVLEGDRMRVEVSVETLVEACHEQCEATVARTLFGEEAS